MQSSIRVIVSLVFLSSAFASYHSSTKLRRDGILNLYPFPRVGRASRTTWQLPLKDFFLDNESVEKRQLYAFPRVGRTELSFLRDHGLAQRHLEFQPVSERRVAESADPGMWFGPRLGRSYKSEEDDNTNQLENNDHSEPEQIESIHEDRKKREVTLM